MSFYRFFYLCTMHRLGSALRKEFLILIRDIPGLAILFIMPVLLIMIVTLAQQNALKSSKESKTDVLFIDHAHSVFSKLLKQNLDSSGLYGWYPVYQTFLWMMRQPVKRSGMGIIRSAS